jgi:hypothetical protein
VALIESDIVEDVELEFWAEVSCVGDSALLKVIFRLAGDVSCISRVGLACHRVLDVADKVQRRKFGEWIFEGARRIRDQEQRANGSSL